MCIPVSLAFKACPHNGTNTPYLLAYIDTSDCPHKKCIAASQPLGHQKETTLPGSCFACRNIVPPDGEKIVAWFKHCEKSLTCGHDFGHCEIDGLERYESEPDYVLETPTPSLCPDCKARNYDAVRLGPSAVPSRVPAAFVGRTRTTFEGLAELRARSQMARCAGTMLMREAPQPPSSRMGSGTPGAISMRDTSRGGTCQMPSSRARSDSQGPPSSISQQLLRAPPSVTSYQPSTSQRPPSSSSQQRPRAPPSTYRPSTARSKSQTADYQNRGSPRNTAASGVYQPSRSGTSQAPRAPPSVRLPSGSPSQSATRGYDGRRTRADGRPSTIRENIECCYIDDSSDEGQVVIEMQ
ncbi:hypothetical protein BJ875DRAFT_82853 [Amylocarpus encephaloides]|uniref:Uncharacterized protein n=1 Tax=Amylocarpus encephaloides TaxID=45428 RepID=A0A9P7YG20_9HELO|nr:hypothetical protein BJ875DRAFT_82853 [Amylocarpus encephaloides]